MRVVKTIEELEEVLSKRWYAPEHRLYKMLMRTRGEKNKRRYLTALVEKLARKHVVLLPSLVEELYRYRPPPRRSRGSTRRT